MLRWRETLRIVTLSNGTTFTARYERISRKQLPRNIRVRNTGKIGPRRKNRSILSLDDISKIQKITQQKKVKFNRSATALKRMRNNKRKQSGKGIGENLAKLGFEMGSRPINSSLGKRPINKGVDSILSIFKYGVSKRKNKHLKRGLDSDVADIMVEKGQTKLATNLIRYFKKWEE